MEGFSNEILCLVLTNLKQFLRLTMDKHQSVNFFQCRELRPLHMTRLVLELLALNQPTVLLPTDGLLEIHPNAQRHYSNLIEAGLIHTSAQSLARHLNENWEHIDEWWQTEKVQIARASFCQFYSLNDGKVFARSHKALKTLQKTLRINKRN